MRRENKGRTINLEKQVKECVGNIILLLAIIAGPPEFNDRRFKISVSIETLRRRCAGAVEDNWA